MYSLPTGNIGEGTYAIEFSLLSSSGVIDPSIMSDKIFYRGSYNISGPSISRSLVPFDSPRDNLKLEFLPVAQVTGIIQTPDLRPVDKNLFLSLNVLPRISRQNVVIPAGESSTPFSIQVPVGDVIVKPILSYTLRLGSEGFNTQICLLYTSPSPRD